MVRLTMNSNIFKTFALAALMLLPGKTWADSRVEKANQHYAAEEYYNAIQLYEDVLKSGMEGPELYYNLGNCYYRQGLLPAAILNYERALLHAPHDKDIRYNLELAYSQIPDKIEPLGEIFIAQWFASIRNITKSDTWAWISIASFSLFLILLLIYFFSKRRALRKIGFFVGLIFLIISVTTFFFAKYQKQRLANRDTAIVFSPSVTVRSAPDAGSTELFVLHEGVKVKLLKFNNNWYEIQIEDGNEGWIHAEHVEVI